MICQRGGSSRCRVLLFLSVGRRLPVDVRGRDLGEAAVEGRDAAKRLCAELLGVREWAAAAGLRGFSSCFN